MCLLRFDDLGKDVWVARGELGEDLAVELDLLRFEGADDLGVAHAHFAHGGADADLVEGAVIALLELAVAVGVDTALGHGHFGQGKFGLAAPHHALRPLEDILAALDVVHAAFDTCHRFGVERG